MISIVYFTSVFPCKILDELIQAGYQVWEAMAISEVLHLLATERIDIVVIAPEIDEARARVVQQHCVGFQLEPQASTADVIWELSQLFQTKPATIQ